MLIRIKKYRIITLFLLVICGILLFSGTTYGAQYTEDPLNIIESLDISTWEDYFKEASFFNGTLTQYVKSIIQSGDSINVAAIGKALLSGVIDGVRGHFPWVCVIITLGVLSAIAHTLMDDSARGGAMKIAITALTSAGALVILNGTASVVEGAGYYIQRASSFTRVASPVLSALVIATGKVATGGKMAVYTTVTGELCYAIADKFLLPILTCICVLSICSQISGDKMLSGVCKSGRNICNWSISILFGIVFSVASLNGLVAGMGDSLTSQSIKSTLSAFSSLGGGYLSKGLDTIVSCAGVAKGALGIAGVITIAFISVFPSFNILGIALLYKGAGGILAFLGEEKISASLTSVGGVYTTIFLCVVAASVLCGVMIAIMVASFAGV